MKPETADFLEALRDLEQALEAVADRERRMRERITYLRRELDTGRSVPEIVPTENSPILVQLLTETANILHTYGTRVRRTEARALHREGMTMDEIARFFGVTRQRVSALLRDSAGEDGV